MARNSEKAQAMLNRFLQGKKDEARGPKARRPYLATECHDLNEADKWRQDCLREIGRKVMEIQNQGLAETKLRDLNDEINKLIREKGHWEKRIVELGGPDYSQGKTKVTDAQGDEIRDATGRGQGYRYFGAARSLPGVKELFEKEAPRMVRRTRHQIYKNINADYYGFRDEEDGVLMGVEGEAEKALRKRIREEWERRQAEEAEALAQVSTGDRAWAASDALSGPEFVAFVPLPDERDIEERVVEKKKRDLLAKYMSEELIQEQETARALRQGE